MKVFHCAHCQQLVFFENTQCVNCGRTLAYLPDLGVMASLDQSNARDQGNNGQGGNPPLWQTPIPLAQGRRYRLCDNYSRYNLCNWAVDAGDDNTLCRSCRLTQAAPSLSRQGARDAWYKLEVAKRRVIYSLLQLGCPVEKHGSRDGHGLAFEFLGDGDKEAGKPVLTGHAQGVITVNIAEADDAERERRRLQLQEPYRTLVGHLRHEVGHYYWERLVQGGARLEQFRAAFGDERRDYGAALKSHYSQGAPPDWQQRFVSAYAAAHPWEDWAETWAHYLHMTDTLETAVACGLSLMPWRADEPVLKLDISRSTPNAPSAPFERLINNWFPVTYLLNNLNRGMGLPDGYPFVLSPAAIEKLRFVHETIAAAGEQESIKESQRRSGTQTWR
ncbi:MAG: putative zinc-binding metallopeptidase [Steroidobacterales bacterium]